MLLGERNLILTFYQLDNQIDFFIGNYYSGGEAFKGNDILNFPTTRGFRMNISMKLIYQYMTFFSTFSLTANHLHPLQVEN